MVSVIFGLTKTTSTQTINQRLHDIVKQNWFSEVQNNSCCTNYRIFKTELTFENYLIKLTFSDRIALCRFRSGNIKLPSNVGRFNNNSVDITCKVCNLNVTGDEYHYIFVCNAFDTQRDNLLSFNFTSNHRSSKMSDLFNSKDTLTLLKLAKFTKIISCKFQ